MNNCEVFLASCRAAVAKPLPTAERFCERWRGLQNDSLPWLWFPGCGWVHGLGMREALVVIQPAADLRRIRIGRLPPGTIARPWLRASGTLEMRGNFWQEYRDRLLGRWWTMGWEIW